MMILWCSCDPLWIGYEKVYIQNHTDRNMQVRTQYFIAETNVEDTLIYLHKNAERQLISDYCDGGGIIGKPAIRNMKVLIYDVQDSVYYMIKNDVIIDPFFDKFNSFVRVNSTVNERAKTCLYEVDITINDSLISLMTKNTALTDSIFGLK